MIDASTFATHHNAFWASYTPTSEHFVRRVNLEYADRWGPPIDKPDVPFRAAYVAEIAFAIMCGKFQKLPSEKIWDFSIEEAKHRLRPLMEDPHTLDQEITDAERKQISMLEGSLYSFFNSRRLSTKIRPSFSGCGYIDTSEGDILTGASLFEIKTVDRPFRSVDMRQLITYCALNQMSGDFELENIGIFNPRRGLYFETTIDEAASGISGLSAQELCDAIIHAVSSGDISR